MLYSGKFWKWRKVPVATVNRIKYMKLFLKEENRKYCIFILTVMKEETPYSLLHQGRDLLEEGNPAQAAIVLERARTMEPEKGSILEVLGRAYFMYGEYSKASECYEKAIEVDPTNDYAHYCLGLCLLKEAEEEKAGKHFKIAWSLRPLDDYRFMALRFGAEEEDR